MHGFVGGRDRKLKEVFACLEERDYPGVPLRLPALLVEKNHEYRTDGVGKNRVPRNLLVRVLLIQQAHQFGVCDVRYDEIDKFFVKPEFPTQEE